MPKPSQSPRNESAALLRVGREGARREHKQAPLEVKPKKTKAERKKNKKNSLKENNPDQKIHNYIQY